MIILTFCVLQDGKTPLHLSTLCEEIFFCLIDKGANLEIRDQVWWLDDLDGTMGIGFDYVLRLKKKKIRGDDNSHFLCFAGWGDPITPSCWS